MARSKSSQSPCNFVMAVLTLWSVISLIVITVWATSPFLKSESQCKAEKQALTEKMEGAKVVYEKDEQTMVEELKLSRENQTKLKKDMDVIAESLGETSLSLNQSLEENAILNENQTALRNAIGLHRETQRNQSLVLSLQRDHADALEFNLTHTIHQSNSCSALYDASRNQEKAATSQGKACESSKQYLIKLMEREGCDLKKPLPHDRMDAESVAWL